MTADNVHVAVDFNVHCSYY